VYISRAEQSELDDLQKKNVPSILEPPFNDATTKTYVVLQAFHFKTTSFTFDFSDTTYSMILASNADRVRSGGDFLK
jgi:hypothetical protein